MSKQEKPRFEVVKKEKYSLFEESIILKDTETNMLYIFFQGGYAGGITPLLDKDGKPIIEQ